MKKILILFLSVVASLCFMTGCSLADLPAFIKDMQSQLQAQTPQKPQTPPENTPLETPPTSDVTSSAGLAFELSDDETYYWVSGIGECTESDIVISYVHEGKPVKGVRTFAFRDCNTITSVYLDKGIEYIESYAFFKCNNLINITLNEGLETIEEYAFRNCYKLSEVRNLSTLELTLGDEENGYVAYYAEKVYEDETPFSPFTVSADGFITAEKAEQAILLGYIGTAVELTLPSGIDNKSYEVYEKCFYGCADIIKLTFGTGAQKFGAGSFYGCEKLATVEYTATFDDWCEIEFIDESSNPLSAGAKLYMNGEFVEEIEFSSDAKDIPAYAFCGYQHVTKVTIETGACEKIGNDAFNGCSKLSSVSIGNSIKQIGSRAFHHCENLTDLSLSTAVERIEDGAFAYCKKLPEINFPSTLTFIGKQAFWQNLSLTSLEIPASVLEVDDEAFGGCQNVQTLTLNEGLETIGAGVFSSCKSLVTVRIPHSVTSVGDSAFDRCSGLDLLIVGDGITELSYKFAYATNQGATDGDGLNKIVIGMNVKSIGDWAIAGWKGTAGGIIYYKGTQASFQAITLGYGTQVNYAKYVYYFTNTRPTTNPEKYWHYVDGVPTLWSES